MFRYPLFPGILPHQQAPAELVKSGPFADGLLAVKDTGIGRYLTPFGPAINFRSGYVGSTYNDFINTSLGIGQTRATFHSHQPFWFYPGIPAAGDFTLLVIGASPASATARGTIGGLSTATSGVANTITVGDGTTAGKFGAQLYINGSFRYPGGSFSVTANKPFVGVLRHKNGVEQAVFLNGVKDPATLNVAGNNGDVLGFFTSASSHNGSISILEAAWNRALTDTEIWLISQDVRSYLFQESRIWVPEAAGTTAVTSDSSASYFLKGDVQSSTTPAYDVRAAVESSVTPAYNVKAVVPSDASANYTLRAAVTADSTPASYNIQSASSVVCSLSVGYSVRGIVAADESTAYSVRVAAQASLGGSYYVHAAVATDEIAAYKVRAYAQASLAASYGVNAFVTADKVAEYNLRAAVLASLEANHYVHAAIVADEVAEYQIRSAVLASLASAYGVSGGVVVDLAGSYAMDGVAVRVLWEVLSADSSQQSTDWEVTPETLTSSVNFDSIG